MKSMVKPLEKFPSARTALPFGEVFQKKIPLKDGKFASIRRWKPQDSNRKIFDLHKRAMESVPNYPYCKTGWDKDLKDIKKNYMRNRNDFLVLVIGRKIIGFAGLRERKDLGENIVETARIRIAPEYQGAGLGSRISEIRWEIAKKLGFEKAYGETSGDQKARLALFQKEGWTLLEIKPTEWMPGIIRDVHCFEKEIQKPATAPYK